LPKAHDLSKQEWNDENEPVHESNVKSIERAIEDDPAQASSLADGKKKLDELQSQHKDSLRKNQFSRARAVRMQYKEEIEGLNKIDPSINGQTLMEFRLPKKKKSLLDKIREGEPIYDMDQ
jgi:hypothetical protein